MPYANPEKRREYARAYMAERREIGLDNRDLERERERKARWYRERKKAKKGEQK